MLQPACGHLDLGGRKEKHDAPWVLLNFVLGSYIKQTASKAAYMI